MTESLDERKVRIEEERLKLERARDQDSRRFLNRRLGAVITAVVSVATVVLSIVQWQLGSRRSEQDAIAADARAKREFDLESYRVITASLVRRDSAEQLAALSLVPLVNDSGVRQGLLDALTRSGLQTVRTQASAQQTAERRFAAEQALVQQPARSPGWRYDVFVCEPTSPEVAALAEQVIKRLQGASVQVRRRVLPRSVNLRPGYYVNGFEVRHEATEQTQADQILARLGGIGGTAAAFRLVPVTHRTPQYLSVYLCP